MLELVLQSKSPDLEKQKILDYIRNLITNEFLFTNLRKVAISHKDLDDLTNILKDINNQRKLTEDLLQIKNSIKVSMIGLLFNNITPFSSGGQPMQAYELTKTGKRVSDS